MSLKHALLGFLDLMPLSGYDLAKMFDDSVNFYWPANHTQIYRTLKTLYEAGWVSMEVVEQTERPDKKVYSITPAGEEELQGWITKPLAFPSMRHGLLVQLAFASRLEDAQIIALLDAYAQKLRVRLESYQSGQQQEQLALARSERERYLWGLILRNGIQTYESELQWAEQAIDELRRQAWKGNGE